MSFEPRPTKESLPDGNRLAERREAQLVALDASLARGVAASEAGRGKLANEVFDRLAAKYAAMYQELIGIRVPPVADSTASGTFVGLQ